MATLSAVEMESRPGAAGHFWTIAPNLLHRVLPVRAPRAEAWTTTTADGATLRGRWCPGPPGARALLVVHGLGGSHDRHYCLRMAREAARRGWSSLRIALRGADRRGADFYHAGLVEDLDAALRSPELGAASRVDLVGYSLGGHVCLRFAAVGAAESVGSVAAVCPPLDLAQSQAHLDSAVPAVYRRHVLGGLKEIYRAVAARAPVPTPVERMMAVRTIREWDSLSIVPRWGFRDVDHYYASQSVAPRLGEIQARTLVVASRRDPMVHFAAVEEQMRARPASVEFVPAERGGHVGFPPGLDLGLGAQRGLEGQIADWLERSG